MISRGHTGTRVNNNVNSNRSNSERCDRTFYPLHESNEPCGGADPARTGFPLSDAGSVFNLELK